MQICSENLAVRGLPSLWGAHLVGRLETDITGLNRGLTFAPNESPFKFLSNPAPYPPKGVPKVFERVVLDGHWPDAPMYSDPNEPENRFNLLKRVELHLPGSADWLCKDLKRPAQELPHDERAIQTAIHDQLARIGLTRLHPSATLFLNEHAFRGRPELLEAMLKRPGYALSCSPSPGQATLVTLLFQEWICFDRARPMTQVYQDLSVRAWTRVFRSKHLRRDRRLYRSGLRAIRSILYFIATARPLTPAKPWTAPAHALQPFCPIIAASPAATAAEALLNNLFWEDAEWRLDRMQSGSNRRISAPPKPAGLEAEQASDQIVQSFLGGLTRISTLAKEGYHD